MSCYITFKKLGGWYFSGCCVYVCNVYYCTSASMIALPMNKPWGILVNVQHESLHISYGAYCSMCLIVDYQYYHGFLTLPIHSLWLLQLKVITHQYYLETFICKICCQLICCIVDVSQDTLHSIGKMIWHSRLMKRTHLGEKYFAFHAFCLIGWNDILFSFCLVAEWILQICRGISRQ